MCGSNMGEIDEVKTMGWDKTTIKYVRMFHNAMEKNILYIVLRC